MIKTLGLAKLTPKTALVKHLIKRKDSWILDPENLGSCLKLLSGSQDHFLNIQSLVLLFGKFSREGTIDRKFPFGSTIPNLSRSFSIFNVFPPILRNMCLLLQTWLGSCSRVNSVRWRGADEK